MDWILPETRRHSTRRRPGYLGNRPALVESLERRQLLAAGPTATSLVASGSAIAVGQTLTLTATVVSGSTRVGDGGVVTFRDGATVLGSAPVVDGTATLATATLAVGRHALSARFGGTDSLAPSDTGDSATGRYLTVAGSEATREEGNIGPSYRPEIVRADRAGNLYVATSDYLIRKIAPSGAVTTVAGTGEAGYSGDGGPATRAAILVDSMTVDDQGDILIGDAWNRSVRRITPDGLIHTVIGSGGPSIVGAAGPRSSTDPSPSRLTVDGAGNLYIADGYAGQVIRVTPSGVRQVIAGLGTRDTLNLPRFTDPTDGDSALSVGLGNISDIVADRAGHVFVTSTDPLGVHFAVREIDPDGTVRTVFTDQTRPPYGFVSLAVDDAGDLFVAVPFESRIYEVRPDGTTSIVAGLSDPAPPVTSPRLPYAGDGQVAQGNAPGSIGSIAVDASGTLVYLDSELNVVRGISDAVVVTVAPDPTAAVRFVVTPAATTVAAGQPLSFVVTAVNGAGTLVPDYAGTVHFTSNDGSPTLPGDVILQGGTGTFTATFRTATQHFGNSGAATRRIRVSDGASLSGSSAGIVVDPAAAARFRVTGPTQVVEGQPNSTIPTRFSVTPEDAFGNPLSQILLDYRVSGQAAGDQVDTAGPWGAGPITLGGWPVTFDFGFRATGIGPRTLVVTDNNNPALTGSITFEVVAAPPPGTTNPGGPWMQPSPLLLPIFSTIVTPGTVVAGSEGTYELTLRDGSGNTLTNFNGPVTLASSDPQAALPGSVEVRNGRASFVATLRTAGSQSIRVQSSSEASFTGESDVVVRAGRAVRLDITTAPQDQPGQPVAVIVTARDAFGNVATDSNDEIALGIDEQSLQSDGDALLNDPSGLTLRQGIGRLNLSFGSAGWKSITFSEQTDPGLTGTAGQQVRLFYATAPGYEPTVLNSVSGVLYRDLDGDNVPSPGEPRLAGQVVFEDFNGNAILDLGEPMSVSDANGLFRFPDPEFGERATIRVLADGVTAGQLRTERDRTVTLGLTITDPAGGVDARTAYVRSLYRNVLGRVGSAAEVAGWVQRMEQGESQADVAEGFVRSEENRLRQATALYQRIFRRNPDPFARYWVDALGAGASEDDVAAALFDSAEYRASHPDDASFTQGLYRSILGREADLVGMVNIQQQLTSGTSRATVIRAVLDSEEAVDRAIEVDYRAYFHRTADPFAASWETVLRSSPRGRTLVARSLLSSDEFVRDAAAHGTKLLG